MTHVLALLLCMWIMDALSAAEGFLLALTGSKPEGHPRVEAIAAVLWFFAAIVAIILDLKAVLR